VAWLRDPRTRWLDQVRPQLEASGVTGVDVFPAFFDAVARWFDTQGFRGSSPHLTALVEIPDPGHPARQVIIEYTDEVEQYIESLIARAGYADVKALASAVQTLLAGAMMLGRVRRNGTAFADARDAAMTLLRDATRR